MLGHPLSSAAAACVVFFVLGRWSQSPPIRRPLQHMEKYVAEQTYKPPPGHGEVAVPSTHEDIRGAVHNLRIGGFRFNVLVSRSGVLRSGDVHPCRQFDMIFQGRVQVTTREEGRDVNRMYSSGDLVVIPPHIPHLFAFLDETVMAEWWDGTFDAQYYRPYRQRVDEIMRRMAREAQHAEARAPLRTSQRKREAHAVDPNG